MTTRERLSREEIARREVGHTDVRPGVARLVVSFFLATILVVPVLEVAVGVHRGGDGLAGWWRDLGPRRIAAAALRGAAADSGGAWSRLQAANAAMLAVIHEVEGELDEDSAVGDALRPPVQEVLSARLGAGNEKVYCGQDGWLFYRPAVEHLTGPGFLDPRRLARRAAAGSEWRDAPAPDPRPAILEFRDQLAARGIELLVLPVPVKASLQPEHLGGEAGTVVENASASRWRRELAAVGVHVFDPAPVLSRLRDAGGEPVYLATDTHWRPEAVAAVADSLAAWIAAHGALPPVPRPDLRREAVVLEGTGDLATMLDLPAGQRAYPPEEVRTDRIVRADETHWRPDPGADVLLLGDSFTNVYSLAGMGWGESAGLAEELSFALGRPLDAIVRNDDGAHATRLMLSRELARGRDRLAGKRLVIWEFTARELSVGDWRSIPLALGEAVPGEFLAPAAGESLLVRGTIADVAPAPLPRSAPYADYIVAVHLVDVGPPGAEAGDDEALVYVWAMRDYAWTAGARYRAGERLDLVLRPWADVAEEVETVSRGELMSRRLLRAEPCWGEEVPGREEATIAREREAVPQLPPVLALPAAPTGGDLLATYRAACGDLLRLEIPHSGETVPARAGWLLVSTELRFAASGPFWGADAAAANPRCPPAIADPIPAILELAAMLARHDVDLVLAPVPVRCVVYPESVLGPEVLPPDESPPRLQPYEAEFYAALRDSGIEVVDLTEVFLSSRGVSDEPLFVESDTHWTPHGAFLAARAVAARAMRHPWYSDLPKVTYRTGWGEVEHRGGIYQRYEKATGVHRPGRTLRYRSVLMPPGARDETLPRRDPDAPVVLIGDSYNIWWKDRNASFQHQLACELGVGVDCLYARGGGSFTSRQNLARALEEDPEYLQGKHLVVWCMTIRVVANSADGWPLLEFAAR